MTYPAFSEFRNLLTIWDEAVSKEKIQSMLEGNGFVLFFIKEGIVYGAAEGSRVTFAKLKNPGEESKGWVKEANFGAFNLEDALDGKKTQAIFSNDDLGKIKVIDKDKAESILAKKVGSPETITIKLADRKDLDGEVAPDDPPSAVPMGEK